MSQQFRQEVRQWLEENCPASMRTPMPEAEEVWGGRRASFPNPDSKIWLERMAAKGWTAPEWPQAYGGGGLSPQEALILKEEMNALNCRPALMSFGLWMLGPVLLAYGTDEQKQRLLPAIVRGEIRWCQGYSEPAAGSDLASLQTRAERVGDEFLINGSKVWTSYADHSDWIFCLVRTDASAKKPQQGISFLLFDMQQEGIKAEPIRLISGKSPFCEVFFSNARAKAENLIGALNGGWTIAKALLSHERSAISEMGKNAEDRPLAEIVRGKMGTRAGKIPDASLRDRLARFQMDDQAFQWALERSQFLADSGHSQSEFSSLFKYYGTELNKRKYELMMEALGHDSLLWEGDNAADIQATRDWLRSKGNSIEGGTSEIQLNVIAKRVLGLP